MATDPHFSRSVSFSMFLVLPTYDTTLLKGSVRKILNLNGAGCPIMDTLTTIGSFVFASFIPVLTLLALGSKSLSSSWLLRWLGLLSKSSVSL